MTTPLCHVAPSADERRLELTGYEAHLRHEAAAVEILERIQAASEALQKAAEELAALGEAYRTLRGGAR